MWSLSLVPPTIVTAVATKLPSWRLMSIWNIHCKQATHLIHIYIAMAHSY
jgi:hypothetical protein